MEVRIPCHSFTFLQLCWHHVATGTILYAGSYPFNTTELFFSSVPLPFLFLFISFNIEICYFYRDHLYQSLGCRKIPFPFQADIANHPSILLPDPSQSCLPFSLVLQAASTSGWELLLFCKEPGQKNIVHILL